MREFLRDFAPTVGKKEADCVLRLPGETSDVQAIPLALTDTFLTWFENHLGSLFYDFETNLTPQAVLLETAKKEEQRYDEEDVSTLNLSK